MALPPSTLLVIDDDDLTRQVLALLLKEAGWTLYEAVSGEAALALLPALEVDVVLSDLQMPGLCGSALATALRPLLPSTAKILAITATRKSKGTPAGFDGFLLKPFTATDLTDALSTMEQTLEKPTEETTENTHSPGHTQPDLNEDVWQKLMTSMPPKQAFSLYDFAIQDASARVEAMHSALLNAEYEQLRAQAHALKGSAGMIGASKIHALTAAIDDKNSMASIRVPLEEHLNEIGAAIARLRSILLERSKA